MESDSIQYYGELSDGWSSCDTRQLQSWIVDVTQFSQRIFLSQPSEEHLWKSTVLQGALRKHFHPRILQWETPTRQPGSALRKPRTEEIAENQRYKKYFVDSKYSIAEPKSAS